MDRKRSWVYFGVLASVLIAGLLAITLVGASRGQAQPAPVPGKLDAVLGALLSTAEDGAQLLSVDGVLELENAGRDDQYSPLYTSPDGRPYVDVLIETDGSQEGFADLGIAINGAVGDIVSARIPLESVAALTSLENVLYIESERRLSLVNDAGVPATGAPAFRARTGGNGSGAIVGVIDSGVDFTHNDFRDINGLTRILLICDQTDAPQAGDQSCPGNGTASGGTLWTRAQIDTALPAQGSIRQTDPVGHGSHVLGSAAGNDPTFGGMAPGADIIFVKSTLTTTDLVSAISFIDQKAASFGKPYVINMSLGGQIGPHDGTDLTSKAIDGLSGPGKVVVVAAGNDGGDKIHDSGSVASAGTTTTSFSVPNGTQVVTVDIWYPGSDIFAFKFRLPSGGTLSEFVNPGESFPSPNPNIVSCIGGTNTCFRVDHSVTQTVNNSKNVRLLIVPRPGVATTIDQAGTWSFSLTGTTVNAGTFDSWIVCFGASCDFPAGDDSKTVAEPGMAQRAITVGAYTTKDCWQSIVGVFCWNPKPVVGEIASFSSKCPTRDGRQKPEIAAPGQGIASTRSKDAAYPDALIALGGKHGIKQGTSMATPHVAGAVALLLSENPTLTSEQIKALLQNHAVKDSFTGTQCNNTWGCGKMNIANIGAVAPSAPTLVAPADNVTVAGNTPLFDWDPSNGDIRSYQLRVTSGDIGPGPFDLDVVVNPATEYQVTSADALADATYTWNVIARDVVLNTASSATRTFTVQTGPAGPKTLSVTKTADTNDGTCDTDCSLREAIAAAASGDKVAVPSGIYTLTLGIELAIGKSFSVEGAGSGDTIIQAHAQQNAATHRVFHVTGDNVAISDVTIRHGNPSSGAGGIWNDGGSLTLTDSSVSNNGGTLGGILNTAGGTLTVTDSEVRNNTGTADSAGVLNSMNASGSPRNTLSVVNSTISNNTSRGLWNGGTLTVSNTTISGNTFSGNGAGIYNFSCCGNQNATATVTNSTITGNSSISKSGIWNNKTITVVNTIVAGNTGSSSPDCNSFTSLGHNLIGNTSGCSFTPAAGDKTNVNPNLGSLADNGGPTQTHALLPGSPAIDAGDDSKAPTTDQRGVARPQGS